MVYMSLVVNLVCQRSPDVLGRLSLSRDVIGCEDCKKVIGAFRSVLLRATLTRMIIIYVLMIFH